MSTFEVRGSMFEVDGRRTVPRVWLATSDLGPQTSNCGRAGRWFTGLCLGLTSSLLAAGLAVALPQDKPSLPGPLGYVSDHAGVLEAEWKARIRSVCQDLERK